ncbi:MAG: hypothetical protein KAR19_05765 [Bacteroidales bacterium]|nr:hypothetical protein [Bacteroidales bacterium]
MRRFIAYIGLVFFASLYSTAQTPEFYLGFDQILDNREYFTPYAKHQTIFGARINAGASFSLDSVHSVHAGINYMYEFGGELLGVEPQIDLYYRYKTENLQIYFGSFPRRDLMNYPLFLLTDSLDYYRPNIEGASIRYSWDWGTVHGWVDWTGRASEDTRESILAGIDATFRAGLFYFSPTLTRYHLARSEAADDHNHIRDDGAIMLLAGIDLSDRIPLDLFNFASGLATTYERTMPSDYLLFNGWFSQLDMKRSIFGIKGIYYLGDSSPLLYGEPLYSSGNYGRLDFFVDPFKNPRISSKFGWNLHFLPGEGILHSQQILIHISL